MNRPPHTIKGAGFRGFVSWVEKTEGRERLLELVRSLPAEHQRGLDPDAPCLGILASTWYPAPQVHALLDLFVGERSPAQRRELADQAARAILGANLRGIHRVLFRWMANPDRYAKYAGKLWTTNYRTGTLEVHRLTPTSSRSFVRDWPDHTPFLCDINRASGELIYTEMGCKGATMAREACVDEGAEACQFLIQWDE